MMRKVIDRFVKGWLALSILSHGDHLVYRFGVRKGELLSLICVLAQSQILITSEQEEERVLREL